MKQKFFPFFIFLLLITKDFTYAQKIIVGAERPDEYLQIVTGKKVGLIINQTSKVNEQLLPDYLIEKGINVKKIYSPEHGFKANIEAGEHVNNEDYVFKGHKIKIISLYGDKKQASKSDLDSIDVMIFDIQDVGTRFYTYLSTLHYMMLSASENDIPLIILDRPNPNGNYIDGPVLKNEKLKSFVGLHPIPIVHGCTLGEIAQLINGENWLGENKKCKLQVVKINNYTHSTFFEMTVAPSPNLNTCESIFLYPSLCWFEGTVCSVGRGTEKPFRVYGHPQFMDTSFFFTPNESSFSKNPMYKGRKCYGRDLSKLKSEDIFKEKKINLNYLIDAYQNTKDKEKFFNPFFDKLAGNEELKNQIINNVGEMEIRKTWEKDIVEFKKIRKKYLLYEDFE